MSWGGLVGSLAVAVPGPERAVTTPVGVCWNSLRTEGTGGPANTARLRQVNDDGLRRDQVVRYKVSRAD